MKLEELRTQRAQCQKLIEMRRQKEAQRVRTATLSWLETLGIIAQDGWEIDANFEDDPEAVAVSHPEFPGAKIGVSVEGGDGTGYVLPWNDETRIFPIKDAFDLLELLECNANG
jgi:hypothetical protein